MYNELKEGSIKETIYILKRFFSYSKIKAIIINKSRRNEKRIRKSRKSVKLLHQLFMILFVIRFCGFLEHILVRVCVQLYVSLSVCVCGWDDN